RPDFVGFLRPVPDPGVAATGHRGKKPFKHLTIVRRSASHAVLDALRPLCGASRHAEVWRCQVDLHKTQLTLSPFGALLRWQQLRTRLEIVVHGKFVTQSVTNCMPTRSIGTIVVNMSTTRLLHIGTTVG
nr:hypothetical protein [Pseudomonas syringae pv. theae]